VELFSDLLPLKQLFLCGFIMILPSLRLCRLNMLTVTAEIIHVALKLLIL